MQIDDYDCELFRERVRQRPNTNLPLKRRYQSDAECKRAFG